MSVTLRRGVSKNQGLAVLSSWALILVGVAPCFVTLACLAVALTLVVRVVLVLAMLIPLVFFFAPVLQVCGSRSGRSWSLVGSAFWCPWLWSWLWQSWWQWPWLCWKWLR